jgi:hypothetical protein
MILHDTISIHWLCDAGHFNTVILLNLVDNRSVLCSNPPSRQYRLSLLVIGPRSSIFCVFVLTISKKIVYFRSKGERLCHLSFHICVRKYLFRTMWSRDRDVVLVRRAKLIWGNPGGSGNWNGEGRGRERSVYEQPGAKVDGITPHKRRDSK